MSDRDALPAEDRNSWVVGSQQLLASIPPHFEHHAVDGVIFARCTDGRFMRDRCLTVDQHFAILLDGVILNKVELYDEHACDSMHTLLSTLVQRHGIVDTLARLRGPFSGAVLDRNTGVLHSFGNHTGDAPSFFYEGTQGQLLSDNFDLMARVLSHCDISLTFDEHAAQMMLSYGFMLDNHTFATEIRRTDPGAVRSVQLASGHSETEKYWELQFETSATAITFERAIAELDRLFRQAVRRCFAKDQEYGYRRHLVDLSGGWDSRMVNIVARDLGYDEITNLCYSESGSDDRKFAMQLAAFLGNDCVYHPLDRGRSLLHPEQNLRLNSGMGFYAGITGGTFMLRSLNLSEFGLEHTGQLGDVVLGSFLQHPVRKAAALGSGGYSRVNIYSPQTAVALDHEERFLMHTRAYRGALSTHLLRKHFTVAVSPFIDIDLMNFMFSLPLEWRVDHRIYESWIRSRYASALTVPSTRNTTRWDIVRANCRRKLAGLHYRMHRVLSSHSNRSNYLGHLVNQMNPIDYWFLHSAELQTLIADYEARSMALPVSDALRQSIRRAFGPGCTHWDKLLAVTVTAMHRMYFDETGRV